MAALQVRIAELTAECEPALASRFVASPSPTPPSPDVLSAEVRAEQVLGATEARSEEILSLHRRAVERLETNLEGVRRELEVEKASGERAGIHAESLARRLQALSRENEGASEEQVERNTELAAQLATVQHRFADSAASSRREEAALESVYAALTEVRLEYAEAQRGHFAL